jgi:VWFA-related protein
MKRVTSVVAVTVLFLIGSLAIRGAARQQQPPPTPRFRTGVELVVLDVSVLDRDRRPVRGLSAADFTILEDGRTEPVASFSAIDLPDTVDEVPAAPWIREVAPDVRSNTDFTDLDRRLVAIVLDDATPMRAVDVLHVRQLGRSAVEALGPRDLACIVYAQHQRDGQDFTEDRARLLAAVDRFNGAIGDAESPTDAFTVKNFTNYWTAVGTVRGVADALGALPERRKALLWISIGLPLDWSQAGPVEIPTGQDATGTVTTVIHALEDLLASAGRANVNIYGLDPGGLRAPEVFKPMGGTTQLIFNPGMLNREFLATVSQSTGGFAVVGTNDPEPGLRQILRENASYYLLGYAPTNRRAEGRYRKIEVRANRPGVTVRARTGYYELRPGKKAKAGAPPAGAAVALVSALPKSDLTMQVTAAPFALPGRREAGVAIVLGLRTPAPRRATRVVQEVDLRAAAFTSDGVRRGSRHETVPVTLNRPGSGAMIGYELLSRLDLAPGRYQLRLAAESTLHGVQLSRTVPAVALVAPDEDTGPRSGSVYYDLDVPDFQNDPLTLSGLVLGVSPPVASGPPKALGSLVPFTPTTLREFGKDDQVTAFLRIYQGRARAIAPVTLTLRILDGRGITVQEKSETLGTDRFAGGRGADYQFDVPIAPLAPGSHLLTVDASSGKASARRDVRFTVLR